MNDNFQIAIFIILTLLSVAIFVLCRILFNRESTENIRDDIETAERTCDAAGAGIGNAQDSAERIINGIGNAQDSTERIAESNNELKGRIKQCEQIIEEIKNQKVSG